MRMIVFAMVVALGACQSVNVKPCGVLTDSLIDVRGATAADSLRIDRHHARGRGAGCWK